MLKSLSTFLFLKLTKTNSLSQVPRRLSQGSRRVGWPLHSTAQCGCWDSAAPTSSSQGPGASRAPWEVWGVPVSIWLLCPDAGMGLDCPPRLPKAGTSLGCPGGHSLCPCQAHAGCPDCVVLGMHWSLGLAYLRNLLTRLSWTGLTSWLPPGQAQDPPLTLGHIRLAPVTGFSAQAVLAT